MNAIVNKNKIFFTSLAIIIALLYFFNPYKIVNYFIYTLLPIPIIVAIAKDMSIYGKKNENYKYLRLMLIGFIFIFLAEIITFYLKNILNFIDFPAPSDYFFMIAIVFLFAGIIKKIKINKIDISLWQKIALYLIGISGIILIVIFLNNPEFSLYQNTVNILFRIIQLGFVITIYLIFKIMQDYRKGKLYYPWLFILIGTVLNFIAGIIIALFLTSYKQGEYIYVLAVHMTWGAGYIFMGYGFYSIYSILAESTKKIRLKMKIAKLLKNK